MEEINTTIGFYNSNALQYYENTVGVDMSAICERFLKYIPSNGRIIDVGAGSGRDIKYFKDRGYDVEGIDASDEMCRLASEYTGVEVECKRIQDWKPKYKYDGIWANASLPHLSYDEMKEFIIRASEYLVSGGVLYISLKNGIETGLDCYGRFFTDMSEEKVQQILEKNTALNAVENWKTVDGMGRSEFQWLNFIFQKRR